MKREWTLWTLWTWWTRPAPHRRPPASTLSITSTPSTKSTPSTSSRAALLPILSAAVVLGGCAAGPSLDTFEQGRAASFYRRTVDWAEREEAQPPPLPATDPIRLFEPDAAAPEDALARLLAELFDEDAADLAGRLEPLADFNSMERTLERRLDWETLRLAAALHNPSARAAREDWQATLRQYDQAEFLEGLAGQFRAFTRYLDVPSPGEAMTREFFPFPGAIALKGEMLRALARQAELAWQIALREAVIEAGEQYFELQYLVRAAGTVRDNIALLEEIAAVTEEQFRADLVSQADLLRVHNALDEARNSLIDLESSRRPAARARLNALLGRPDDAPLDEPDDAHLPFPPATPEELRAEALERRQEILEMEARVAMIEASIRMGERMNRPLAGPAYGAFERGMMPEALRGGEGFGLEPGEFTPDPGFAQAEAYLAETRRRLEAARRRLEGLRLNTAAEARAAWEDLDIIRREVVLLEENLLPRNEAIHEVSISGFTAGTVTFLEMLEAEREVIDKRLRIHEARRDLDQALVRLARITGRAPVITPR